MKAGGMLLMVVAALAGDGSALGQAASGPARGPLVGMHCDEPTVLKALLLVEAGDSKQAIHMMRGATAGRHGRSAEQFNEVRLGYGMVLLRSGKIAEARRELGPLRAMKHTSAAARAQVLMDIAARQAGHSKDDAPLRDRGAWEAALVSAVQEMSHEARRKHGVVAKRIASRDWIGTQEGLTEVQEVIDRAGVVEAEAASLPRRDLLVLHASLLGSEARGVNVAIATMMKQTSDLAGQMTHHHDGASKRMGYSPADVVTRYNAVVDQIVAANAVGEFIVGTYQQLTGGDSQIKRDATVRMSKTRLPEKRAIFGK